MAFTAACQPRLVPALFAGKSLGVFMSAVQSREFSFILLATTIALACSALPNAGYAYTPEQQQACQGDAFRLCGPEIPDVDRVTACMVQKKSQLSPACAVYFRHGPELRATTRTVSRKSHKAKKPAKRAAT
jgi:hypothetical protein